LEDCGRFLGNRFAFAELYPKVQCKFSMSKGYFIAGIGTDVGKTVASAILVKALDADYWKPIQCGDLEQTDSMKVQNLTGCRVFPEAYRLERPMSPHAAAAAEGVEVALDSFLLPQTNKHLIVEGAGGVLVPLNSQQTVADLMLHLQLPVILISRHYLGSINHTLLTLEVLKQRGIGIAGVLFNGDENAATESIIHQLSGVKVLGRIPVIQELNATSVAAAADNLRSQLLKNL
jgi:dethiobiotin synthetase